MEASKTLIEYSEKHRYACGARYTEGLTNLQKRGGNRKAFEFFLKATKRSGGGVLDSSPEIDRPGGHSEEKDPNRSRGDREHLRGVESPDRNLQIGLQN